MRMSPEGMAAKAWDAKTHRRSTRTWDLVPLRRRCILIRSFIGGSPEDVGWFRFELTGALVEAGLKVTMATPRHYSHRPSCVKVIAPSFASAAERDHADMCSIVTTQFV